MPGSGRPASVKMGAMLGISTETMTMTDTSEITTDRRPASSGNGGALERTGGSSLVGDGGKTELHTGAARSVLDFGCGLKNLFNVQENAVGLSERAAGRCEVVENESAFVHGREEVRAEKIVAQEGKSDDQDGACDQHPRPHHEGAHDARVKVHDTTKKT